MFALADGVYAQPVFNIDPPRAEFGTIEQNEMRSQTLTISNTGTAELRIKQIEATCGCTVPDLENDVLQPGESTPLLINFTAKRSFYGETMKIVHIHTNDPQYPSYELYVTADVHAPIVVDPVTQRVGFKTALRGETATQQVTLTSHDVPVLDIKIDRDTQDHFDLEVVNGFEGDPHTSAFLVTKRLDMPAGEHKTTFRLKTNVAERPTVDIECRAKVTDELVFSPQKINFRYVKDGQNLRNKVRVSLASAVRGKPFKITGAEIDIPGLSARVDETIPNHETYVHIEGKALYTSDERAIAANGRLTGMLRIFSDLPSVPQIEVKVSYMLRM